MLKLRLYLKRANKRSDKTQRLAWVNMFPHLPLTRKPKQSRMGKGKGKLNAWFIFLRAGTVLVELRNLRFGRSLFFLNRLSKKLHVPSFLLKSSSTFVHSNLLISKKLILKMYW
jgi:large subunit ribosomal protein L16